MNAVGLGAAFRSEHRVVGGVVKGDVGHAGRGHDFPGQSPDIERDVAGVRGETGELPGLGPAIEQTEGDRTFRRPGQRDRCTRGQLGHRSSKRPVLGRA